MTQGENDNTQKSQSYEWTVGRCFSWFQRRQICRRAPVVLFVFGVVALCLAPGRPRFTHFFTRPCYFLLNPALPTPSRAISRVNYPVGILSALKMHAQASHNIAQSRQTISGADSIQYALALSFEYGVHNGIVCLSSHHFTIVVEQMDYQMFHLLVWSWGLRVVWQLNLKSN